MVDAFVVMQTVLTVELASWEVKHCHRASFLVFEHRIKKESRQFAIKGGKTKRVVKRDRRCAQQT